MLSVVMLSVVAPVRDLRKTKCNYVVNRIVTKYIIGQKV
jgi:hypothetical protein